MNEICESCGRDMEKLVGKRGKITYFCPYCEGCFDDDEEDDSERLSVDDAALIWACSGEDEDYTFGYSEDELRDTLY